MPGLVLNLGSVVALLGEPANLLILPTPALEEEVVEALLGVVAGAMVEEVEEVLLILSTPALEEEVTEVLLGVAAGAMVKVVLCAEVWCEVGRWERKM